MIILSLSAENMKWLVFTAFFLLHYTFSIYLVEIMLQKLDYTSYFTQSSLEERNAFSSTFLRSLFEKLWTSSFQLLYLKAPGSKSEPLGFSWRLTLKDLPEGADKPVLPETPHRAGCSALRHCSWSVMLSDRALRPFCRTAMDHGAQKPQLLFIHFPVTLNCIWH